MTPILGFDFGTTNCELATMDPTGKPMIISNQRGEERTPSVVFYPQSGPLLIGQDALEQGYLDPANMARNFKLLLGSPESVLGNGRTITAEDAAADMIRFLKEEAERRVGVQFEECVMANPANFRDEKKQALLNACERNGLKVLQLIAEPTAAALAYGMVNVGCKGIYLIYDFGGGTFDTTVLSVDGSEIRVLATEGVAKLGGNDINDVLAALVLEQVKIKTGHKPTPEADRPFFFDLSVRCEQAKISLGRRPKVPIVVSYNGHQVVLEVTQDEFGKGIAPLIAQSLDALDSVVAAAGLKMSDIHRVIMIGGTSRSPQIQEAVANHTGLMPRVDVDPEKAVAFGAAHACLIAINEAGGQGSAWGSVIPPQNVFVRDVTAHAVGCCVIDDDSAGAPRLKQSVIVHKNTPIPCRKEDGFYLQSDDQTEAKIEILQGDPNADRDDCLVIGEILLENLPKEIVRTRRIEVEYHIDANGMVTATAKDNVGGQQKTVSVDYKKGMQPRPRPNAA